MGYNNQNSGFLNENENCESRRNRSDEIKNKASVICELCGRKRTVETDVIEAEKIKVKICQEQDCRFVFENEKIEYTIKITNESDVDLEDVEFKDDFDGSEYVRDSFRCNGKKEDPFVNNHTLRFKLNELEAHKTVVLKFEVKVD